MSQSAAQAQAFYAEVVRHDTVWTIRDAEGFPAPINTDGVRVQPFWSSLARALRIIDTVPAYAGFKPEPIELTRWREQWLPGLERDGLLVGLNWTGRRATGYDIEPGTALERLAAMSDG